MNALSIIRCIESYGGEIEMEGNQLRVKAPRPLPEDLMAQLAAEKPAVMIALGAPFDSSIASILHELRPNLSPALRRLQDQSILALVNWSIMQAWFKTIEQLGKP